MRDALDRVLAGQFILLPPAVDSMDSLNWEEVGSDLDWQTVGDLRMLESLGHGNRTVDQTALRARSRKLVRIKPPLIGILLRRQTQRVLR